MGAALPDQDDVSCRVADLVFEPERSHFTISHLETRDVVQKVVLALGASAGQEVPRPTGDGSPFFRSSAAALRPPAWRRPAPPPRATDTDINGSCYRSEPGLRIDCHDVQPHRRVGGATLY